MTFEKFFEQFRTTPIWQRMEQTVEDSQWHREASVAMHTEMVLQEFDKIAGRFNFSPEALLIGKLALLFHDTGKPHAEEEKVSETRGVYRSYAGHELSSAREFENYWCSNTQEIYNLFFEVMDVNKRYEDIMRRHMYYITWFIEHHLPYDLKKKDRREIIRTHVYEVEESLRSIGLFSAILTADCHGRISDDHKNKKENVDAWIKDFYAIEPLKLSIWNDKRVCILIGVSGSGKTTMRNELEENYCYVTHSWDDLRLEFFKEKGGASSKNYADSAAFYDAAHAFADEHASDFGTYVDRHYVNLLNHHDSVLVDNLNLSAKRRRRFIDIARKKGFSVNATLLPVSLANLHERADVRTDHKVPHDRISSMFWTLQQPTLGEFDSVCVN
jgi:gluconate kinase